MSRRNSSAVTDFLSDIVDDIKDFLDDEVFDRARDTERDVRRAGRNWTDDDDDHRVDRRRYQRTGTRRHSASSRDADLDDLRDALRKLNKKVDELAGGDLPIAGYDDLTVAEIGERLPGLTQAELAQVEDYERAHDERTTLLARIETLRGEQPWPDYDEHTVAQIRTKLADADSDTLAKVKRYEAQHKNRRGVLDAAG